MSEKTATGNLLVPDLIEAGVRLLRESDPSILKRLSFHHIDLLTRPMRDRVTELEQEKSLAIQTIVNTVGGESFNGEPTNELNYLQRLRILVKMEMNSRR